MDIEQLRDYVLEKDGVTESLPFGPDVLVFKVSDKMFLLVSLDTHPLQFNAKCNPDEAIELREQYPDCILPGYHMNKQHWNTIKITGELSTSQLKKFIDDSYTLIKQKKKPKK